MTPRDLDRVMIQIQQWWSRSSPERWSRSSDDPDPVQWCWSRSSDDLDLAVMIQIKWWSRSSSVMMIQIEWWSRSSDDVLWRYRSRWLEYEDELKMKMTWRQRWRELDDDPDDTGKKTCADKLCQENTFLVKRECWCIYNFRMYSLVYFYVLYPDVYSGKYL